MADYFLLSNFGVRYFLFEYGDGEIPTGGLVSSSGTEIESVLSCDLGTFTKENTKYRTLNGNGWESVATLGNSAEDGTFECIREGTGGIYTGGGSDTGTYAKIKDWFMSATEGAGKESPRLIAEALPRGDGNYEGTVYRVIPNQWTPGTKDTETGQEYSFSVTPFGPQTPVSVTVADNTFTFKTVAAG